MLAAIGDTGYKIVLLIHVLSFLGAAGPAVVFPILKMRWKDNAELSRRLSEVGVAGGRMVWGPSLIVLGLTGFALAGMSDEVFKMDQTWLMLAAVVWLALNGVMHALIVRGNKMVSAGDASGNRLADLGGAISGVLIFIALCLMVFKPGL